MKMNTSYEELDADIESQLPSPKEESNLSENCKKVGMNYIKDIPWFLRWTSIWILFMLTIITFTYYIVDLIECHGVDSCQYDTQHDYYLKENYNKTKHRRLTVAGIIHHKRSKHTHSCDDYQFGCCKIYTDCKYNSTEFTEYRTHSFTGIPKHNEDGTNCPSLEDLVSQHNHHYPLENGENCETSNQGCYKIETECDIRIRYLDLQDGTKDDVNLYKSNVEQGYKYGVLVERVGIDEKPTVYTLMYEYSHKYPYKNDTSDYIFIACIIVLIPGLCFSNNR